MTLIKTNPYFAGFSLSLHDHTEPQEVFNQQGQRIGVQPGQQSKSLSVTISLHRESLGATINAGSQTFVFGSEVSPKTSSRGPLPAVDSVLAGGDIVGAYAGALDAFIAEEYPGLVAGTDEATRSGVATYLRLDRVSGTMPKGKPGEFAVTAFIGIYEDAAFTRQITGAGVPLQFASTEHVLRLMGAQPGQTPDTETVDEFRRLNKLLDLSALLASEDVQLAVQTMAYGAMAALQASVISWAGLDVEQWATEFTFPTFS